MDGLSLFKIKKYINEQLIPSELNGVFKTDSGVLLDIYKNNKQNIFLSLKNNIILFNVDISKLSKLDFFYKKQAIVELKQRGYDRALEFKVASRKISGKLEYFYLVVEFVGGNSNFFILNEKRKIIYKFCDNNIDKDRDIGIGVEYSYFKRNKSYTIESPNINNIKTFNDIEGFYLPTSKFADNLQKKNGIEYTIKIINQYLNDGLLYRDAKGRYYPFKIDDSLQGINIFELEILEKKENSQVNLKNKLKNLIIKKIKKEEILLKKLKNELEDALNYEKYKDEAELLKSNYHFLKTNQGMVTIYHYTEEGIKERQVNTNNIRDLDEKIEKLFSKYKKLKRSIEPLKRRIEEIELKILELKEEEFNIENADKGELEIIYKTYFSNKKNIKPKELVERIKKVQFEGYDILIGKNSKSNHELVFHIANGKDLWMHAQKIPSAHIVIRNDKSENIPENVIEFAAKITAAMSKAKNDKKVNIDYTFKKYVKKPPKTNEGFVIYSNFETITVEPLSSVELNLLNI